MIGVVPHFTPPAYAHPPYWPCCDVVGAIGETVCWACEQPSAPRHPPALHTSTGSPVVGEYDLAHQLPDVEHLTERVARLPG